MSSSKRLSSGKGKEPATNDQNMSLDEALKLEQEKRIHRINLDPEKDQIHISGFKGLHPLTTGIAYWFRGHYLYTKGDLTNIVPVIDKPSKAHKVTLSVSAAPPYDPTDSSLVSESTVNATTKTFWNIQEADKESKKAMEEGEASEKRCTLHGHGADCDGKHVSESHVTARAREGSGWTTVEPRIMGKDGRLIMHWVYLLDEEKAKLGN